jgi:tRNA(adenine34) deaminase
MDRASDYESAGRPFESGWARQFFGKDRRSMEDKKPDKKYMRMALEEARKAGQRGEVPIGAVLVKEGQVIAKDYNRCIELHDSTAHAEVLVLRKAGEILKNYRLNDTVVYVTAEPCPMCASAMVHSRISRLVFGTLEPKFGAVESKFKLLQDNGVNHKIEVRRGVLEKECAEILKDFFQERRTNGKRVRSREFARPGPGEFGV